MKWATKIVSVSTHELLFPVVMLLLVAPLLAAQQPAPKAQPVARVSQDKLSSLNLESTAKLLIGPGDLLSISVFNIPEMQQTVRVSEAGDAVVSLIGSVHLAGMTVAAAAVSLEKQYRERNLLVDPHISILVTEYATEGVSVLGEVNKPGVYPLLGPHTLLDIISAAGGLTASAGSTVSIRRRNGAEQTVQLNVHNPEKALAGDVELQPADTVVVARASAVYVVGDVGRPGGFLMQNNGRLTVLQAIALASGANKTASLSHTKIIRKTASGYQQTDIHLSRLLQGKSPDVELEPEDIVFVPNSKVKSAIAGGLPAAAQAAASTVVYTAVP